jgi:hypothetical protein
MINYTDIYNKNLLADEFLVEELEAERQECKNSIDRCIKTIERENEVYNRIDETIKKINLPATAKYRRNNRSYRAYKKQFLHGEQPDQAA